jgi:hypothetical protein
MRNCVILLLFVAHNVSGEIKAIISTFQFQPWGIRLRHRHNVKLVLRSAADSSKNEAKHKGFATPNNTQSNSKANNRRSMSGFAGSGARALRDAANTFDLLRAQGGKEAVSDLYLRSPKHDPNLFWFVGKIARRLDEQQINGAVLPTEIDAVLAQKRVILEYAKIHLRPQNFGGSYSQHLEIWIAPGDSEMDVVQNKVTLKQVIGSANDLSPGFNVKDVGFDPEIYLGDEITQGGLRVKRDEHGQPLKPAFELNNNNNNN